MCQSALASLRSACASGRSKLVADGAAVLETDLVFDVLVIGPAGDTGMTNARAPTAGNARRNMAIDLELSPTARESTGRMLRRQCAECRRARLRFRAEPPWDGDKHDTFRIPPAIGGTMRRILSLVLSAFAIGT